jgi:hypothetical protein
VGFLSAQPNPDHARLIHHQLPDGFSAQAPRASEIADAVVLFKGSVVTSRDRLTEPSCFGSHSVLLLKPSASATELGFPFNLY